jgi:hypothetical protein
MLDWSWILPEGDHRWIMGLRQGESLSEFFADQDPSGAVRAERARWLSEEPHKYAALLPEAEPALYETLELARDLGAYRGDGESSPFAQLLQLGVAWEPDFVWMHPDDEGVHRLIGGVLCFPSSWALTDKIGRPMSEVHGPVPELNTTIGRSIDTFLARQVPGVIWRRENWGISREATLNLHPSRPRRRLDGSVTVDEVWLRLEHQLLLKLPQSGSVLFGSRIQPVPLADVIAQPQAAMRLARLIATLTPAAAAYKEIAAARPRLLALLDGEGRSTGAA